MGRPSREAEREEEVDEIVIKKARRRIGRKGLDGQEKEVREGLNRTAVGVEGSRQGLTGESKK